MRRFKFKFFFIQVGGHRVACPVVCRNMTVIFVISQCLALSSLILAAEVGSTTFFAIKRIATHLHAELKKVVYSPGFFEGLIDAFTSASHTQIFFEFAV